MSKLFFKNDEPIWYVADGTQMKGPLKASEVYSQLQSSEISWVHFISKMEEGKPPTWIRICDEETFKKVGPSAPSPKVMPSKKPPRAPEIKAEEKTAEWFLYFDHAQHGPYREEEVHRLLSAGQVHGRVHAWKEDMEDWVRLSEIKNFKEAVSKPQDSKSHKVQEHRSSPRKPMIAQIFASNGKVLATGICRDISVGGMQVLVDQIPGKVGDRIRLNISPRDAKVIKPFTAEGEIVRILGSGDEGNGFSFRFEKLSSEARESIEQFVQKSSK